jgi:hypothetical protein
MTQFSMKIIYTTLFCLLLTGCFTVPGKDRITTTVGYIDNIEGPGCYAPIRPLASPITTVTYIPADQSFKSKVNYVRQCMINYSWGRGWTDKQNFTN